MADNDYANRICTMEGFTNKTTDASGEIVLTLNDEPIADDGIMLFCGTEKRLVEFVSRAGTAVTVRIRKMEYDRTDTTAGSANNLPSGVTAQTTKQDTDEFSPSDRRAESGAASEACDTHDHGVSFQYTHSHDYTATDLPIAASEGSLSITVCYAFAS